MECKIGDDGSWNQIAGRVPANLPAFTDYGLKSGEKFTYRVRTFNAAGVSNWSNEVSTDNDVTGLSQPDMMKGQRTLFWMGPRCRRCQNDRQYAWSVA